MYSEIAFEITAFKTANIRYNRVFSSTGVKGWTFKYVAITQLQDQAENLVLKDDGRILSEQSVGEITISKGYVTYAIE